MEIIIKIFAGLLIGGLLSIKEIKKILDKGDN